LIVEYAGKKDRISVVGKEGWDGTDMMNKKELSLPST